MKPCLIVRQSSVRVVAAEQYGIAPGSIALFAPGRSQSGVAPVGIAADGMAHA